MGKQNHNSDSALGGVFGVIGALVALAVGDAQDIGGGATFILVLVLGFIGYAVGEWIEIAIVRILFVVGSILTFIMNAAIRRFFGELLSALLG